MTRTPDAGSLWSAVADDFTPDGALRDIYVHGATLGDWEAVLGYLRARHPSLAFSIDGAPAALPATAAEIFGIRPESSPLLKIDVAGVDLACHFFWHEEIEFDLVPGDVTGPERLAAVTDFMRVLATTLEKPAQLTMEGMPDAIILRADPVTGEVGQLPASDAPAS